MRSLTALSAEAARRLAGVVFDLDDTVLDHGSLGEAAYGALFRLREAGLRLCACTGRPAGWGEVLARQWPLEAVVTENGAVAFLRTASGIEVLEMEDAGRARRAELLALAEALIAEHPAAALADDNAARRTDVTIDIGERRAVPAAEVAAMRGEAQRRGVRTVASSVHLHLTRSTFDKASGTIRALGSLGEDATSARARWAFVGDSGNDAAAFAAFALTFGVANVRRYAGSLSVPPRYVAMAEMGAGFAEIAARLVELRR